MSTTRLMLASSLALALIGVGATGYLTVEHAGGGAPVCGIGHGCEVVAQSSYARIGRIPTAAFGLFLYLVLTVLFSARLLGPPVEAERLFRYLGAGAILIGTGASAWLTYVELFVLHAICAWCVASAGAMALLLAVSMCEIVSRRRPTVVA